MQASLAFAEVRSMRDPSAWVELRPVADRAIDIFESAEDHVGAARAWHMVAWYHITLCQYAAADRARDRALAHAAAAGDRALKLEGLGILSSTVWGPLSVTEGLAHCDEVLASAGDNRALRADVMAHQASLVAMRGDFDVARTLYAEGKAIIDDLGRPTASAFAVQEGWYIEMLAGDHRKAEELTRVDYERLLRTDSRALIDITRDMLALAICGQGRFGEADELGRESERKRLHPADVNAQNVWRRVRARALSARGDHVDAVRFAREAEGFFAESDGLNDHGECLLDLAGVLRRAGEIDDAAVAAGEALALYERKENAVEAARARSFLADISR
jgi:tetratricopeptide (TPR) repeat protein